jgi:5-methylcytosine-specific restriction enzyme subunit McrC
MTTSVRLAEWERVGPDTVPSLRGVDLGDGKVTRLAATLARERIIEVEELRTGLSIRAFSHVGRIALGDLVVTVEPKVGGTELLQLVRYAYDLRNLRLLERADFAEGVDLLQDLLVAQLLAEATELVSRGLARRYMQRVEELASPRGRIVVDGLIDGRFLHAGTLTSLHHPRSSDFTLNRVLHAGLLIGARVAVDTGLKMSVRRLAATIEKAVSPVTLNAGMLADARRSLNRLVAAYEPSLRIIELLYACQSLSFDDGGTLSVSGFLFDMNRFFQALLFRFLSEHLPDHEVHPETSIRDMIGYRAGANPRHRRAPRPRPDFLVKRQGATVAVLDAKYRDLWDFELPREMLYQLSIYALSQPRPATATILYPTMHGAAVDAVLELRDPAGGDIMGFVVLRPVVISQLIEAIGERAELARAEALAREWIRPALARVGE